MQGREMHTDASRCRNLRWQMLGIELLRGYPTLLHFFTLTYIGVWDTFHYKETGAFYDKECNNAARRCAAVANCCPHLICSLLHLILSPGGHRFTILTQYFGAGPKRKMSRL